MKKKLFACLQACGLLLMSLPVHAAYEEKDTTFILDVSAVLDGVESDTLDEFATVDVIIDGECVADDVTDYRAELPEGSEYRIQDITCGIFKSFNGYALGEPKGTLTGDLTLRLDFTTIDCSVKGEGTKVEVFNGHTYVMFEREETWYSANEICGALGGHLVSLNSREENDYIANFSNFDIWTGGTDKDDEGNWGWTTGETFDYFGFAQGEPNNVDNNEELEENYLETFHGVWNDSHGNFKKPFVCEFDRVTNPYDFYGFLSSGLGWKNLEVSDHKVQILTEDSYAPATLWRYVLQDDGYYKIISAYDDCLLTAKGTEVCTAPEDGSDSQLWWIDLYPFGALSPKDSDLVLSVKDDTAAPGTQVGMAADEGKITQIYTVYDVTMNGQHYEKTPAPKAPVINPVADCLDTDDITLSWSASELEEEFDERSYAVEIVDPAGNSVFAKDGITDTKVKVGKLAAGTYSAKVCAVNNAYAALFTESSPVTFTVKPEKTEPEPVLDLVFIDDFWYEGGLLQGAMGDPKNITDTIYGYERGREIYDPASDGWYWLDAIYGGKRAKNKEVWMPYLFQEDLKTNANPEGKWVRYDENGRMYKGWYTVEGGQADIYPEQAGNTYYYDLITGAMLKGWQNIEGTMYHFDELTGVLKDN
ncbi:MAG: hypothetical protein IKD69_11010 [Solobacterium sp.]|nr:hypothetical protein [Solobacterium sp.]